MNNGTGRLFLKACHKASAFSGILQEHGKLCLSLTRGGIGGEGGGWAPSGILQLQGREMSCEVKVEMRRPLCE